MIAVWSRGQLLVDAFDVLGDPFGIFVLDPSHIFDIGVAVQGGHLTHCLLFMLSEHVECKINVLLGVPDYRI